MPARKSSVLSGSTSAKVAAFQALKEPPPLNWPISVKMPEDAEEAAEVHSSFINLQLGRSRDHWKPHLALTLAQIALLQLQQRKLTQVLMEEGPTQTNANGWQMRHGALDALSTIASLITQGFKSAGLVGQYA